MQDRPAAPELLEAVAEYLFAELRPVAPAEQRFNVLVAAHLCGVVSRELRAGEEPTREDLELFGRLLSGEEDARAGDLAAAAAEAADDPGADVRAEAAELCRRIRAGEMDERLDEVVGALREHVARKLAVARPGYGI